MTIFREAYDDDYTLLEAGLSDLQVRGLFLSHHLCVHAYMPAHVHASMCAYVGVRFIV